MTTSAGSTNCTGCAGAHDRACGPFWVLDSVSNYCYRFSDDTVTWFQARSLCLNDSSQLASVTSIHSALDALSELMKEHGIKAGDIAKVETGLSPMTHVHKLHKAAQGYGTE